MSSSSALDISVVIVAWNAGHYLEMCLKSLETPPSRRTMEVLVVDNASSDNTVELVESKFPWVKLIKSPKNLGFSKGNNLAIRKCQGRYVALINPDVVVLSGCLDALANFLDGHPKVGNVGPRILNGDMTMQVSCRKFPTLWNNFCTATGLSAAFRRSSFFTGEQMFYFEHDRIISVDVLVGCFSMIRREALNTAGLLDENLFMYADDVDWCRRCWDAGWEVVFYPGAQAIHYRGKTTAPYALRFAVARQRSVLYYWSKYHSFWSVLTIRTIVLFHHLFRYLFAVAASLVRSLPSAERDMRRRASGACLRELFSGNEPDEA